MENQSDTVDSVQPNTQEYDVSAGVIIGAHGVQGGLKFKLSTTTAVALIRPKMSTRGRGIDVWIGAEPKISGMADEQSGAVHIVKQIKELRPGGKVLLLKLDGISDRNSAEAMIGKSIYAPAGRRAKLAKDEYFVEDLIGLRVVTESGRDLGAVIHVLEEPASDVYETDAGAMIPAVKEVIVSIDLEARTIRTTDLIGLMPDEADELRGEENDRDID